MKDWEQITDEARKEADNMLERLSGDSLETEEYLCQRIRERKKYNPQQMLGRWKHERMRRMIVRWSVAASFALLLSFSVYLWQFRSDRPPLVIVQKIEPGSTKAILTLANGTVEHLSDTVLSLIRGNEAVAESRIDKNEEEPAWQTLTVARGGEFAMTLSDGSRVWLNSESELRFPIHFTAEERRVFLKGEGYFEVMKGEKPFRVELQEGTVRVYGTQFNVSNYEKGVLAATLVEGSIGFTALSGKSTCLKPSQHLQYSENRDQLTVTDVNPLVYTTWKNDLFCFEEQTLEEIMKMLGRWYDVETDFETEELKNLKLSGTLEKYADITQFFRLFEFSSEVKFEVNQRKVTIRRK